MKHMTKRILAILLAALMLGTAVACTGSGDPADTNGDTNASTDKPATDDPAKEGCSSAIGMSAVAVLAAASAFAALKKKD